MIKENLHKILEVLPSTVKLVVVSKFRPIEQLVEVHETGQRDFAENRVQELFDKYKKLPKDILWHMIGHLQSNKVKYIAPFIHLIHSLDSIELADEINKQAIKNGRTIRVLLQFHVAKEESKFGFNPEDSQNIARQVSSFSNIEVSGIMGMATLTDDNNLIRKEFEQLKTIFDALKNTVGKDNPAFDTLSMGSDFKIAAEAGSNLVRIGSLVFE